MNRVDIAELAFVADDLRYEASFVFLLPDAVADTIRRVQDDLVLRYSTPGQPLPHMTLQYLGVCDGSQLRRSHEHLAARVPPPPVVRLGGCSSFTEHGIVRNIHIVVEPSAELKRLRDSVRERYLELPWALTALGDEWPFLPHISILEGVALSDIPQVSADLVPPGPVRLARATILTRQVDDFR